MATVAATVAPQPRPPAGLRRALRRSGRREQWRAALLVLPLFLFLLASFIVPIGAMLARARRRSATSRGSCRACRRSCGTGTGANCRPMPRSPRMVDDLRAAREAGTLASAAHAPQLRRRRLSHAARHERPPRRRARPSTSPRQALLDVDPKWGERETWAAIRRAGGPVTDFYLLAALDLRRDADNAIAAAPANESVFRNVLGRTLWIAGVVTLACLLLGYPVALFIARQPPQRAALLLFLVLLPFWTSLLVRTVAWVVLLQREGILNNLLLSLGIVARAVADDLQPLRRLRRDGARAAAVHGAAALRGDEGRSRRRTSARRLRSAQRRSPRFAACTCRRRCPASPRAA